MAKKRIIYEGNNVKYFPISNVGSDQFKVQAAFQGNLADRIDNVLKFSIGKVEEQSKIKAYEYAAANPEECFTGPQTPTGGSGGGGGIGDGMFAPRPSYQRQPFVGVQYTSPVKAITVLNDFIGQELRNSSKKNSLFS